MCNINVIFKPEGLDVTQRLSDMTAISWLNNDDGEGAFFSCDNTVVRSPEKRIPVYMYADKIKKSTCVVFHERLSTSGGNTLASTHPFYNERFVLVHNGVFYQANGWGVANKKSDTAKFFDNFVAAFTISNDILPAIKAALQKTGNGSYSIFIYDKQVKVGYYFKEESTEMNMIETQDGCLVLTTNYKNTEFWAKKKVLNIGAGKLLRVTQHDGKFNLEVVGNLEKVRTYSYPKPSKVYPETQASFGIDFVDNCSWEHSFLKQL